MIRDGRRLALLLQTYSFRSSLHSSTLRSCADGFSAVSGGQRLGFGRRVVSASCRLKADPRPPALLLPPVAYRWVGIVRATPYLVSLVGR